MDQRSGNNSNYNRGGNSGSGRDRGGGRGRSGGGRRGGHNDYQQGQGQSHGGRGRGGAGAGGGSQMEFNQSSVRPWGNRPVQSGPVMGMNPPPAQAWGNRPVQGVFNPPPAQAWRSKPAQGEINPRPVQARVNQPVQGWAPRPQFGQGVVPSGGSGGPSSVGGASSGGGSSLPISDMKLLQISDSPSQALDTTGNRLQPMKRPDRGGRVAVRSTRLVANHFLVSFNPQSVIKHYDVDVKLDVAPGSKLAKKSVPKSELREIREKLFSDKADIFPMNSTAYDGEKNIFSAVELPIGEFKVELFDGEGTRSRIYTFTVTLVNELEASKLMDYLSGNSLHMPREILQGMDLVMKENPSRQRICFGRSTYSREYREEDDLGRGLVASRGFQQSLKITSQGPVLCVNYSVLAFRKRLPVIDFLGEHLFFKKNEGVWGEMTKSLQRENDINNSKGEVLKTLKGLKVNVTHRRTKQKFTVVELSAKSSRNETFTLEDPEGNHPPREVSLVNYFLEKYDKDIMYKDIPCLDVSKGNKKNYVPMEFCVLVEGQRYPKEELDGRGLKKLKEKAIVSALERKNTICEMVRAGDAPCGGDIVNSFDLGVDKNMTSVVGRVIGPPDLKLATPNGRKKVVKVDKEKCQWNLIGNCVVDGKSLDRWALIDFSASEGKNRLNPEIFVSSLRSRCKKLGIRMQEPLAFKSTKMHAFTSVNRLRDLLCYVIEEAGKKNNGRLQLVICVMAEQQAGYKYLKWVSETQLGVVTQCCLLQHANLGKDQYLTNIAMKINAKIGGSNVELIKPLPLIGGEDPVMFIGADVNHPSPMNVTCPSIAAVVGSVNWPAATRYAARVSPQTHRKEKIVNFGAMCLDLVNTYAGLNKVKPKKIVIFRDGVGESQFDMVLNEELNDLKAALYEEHYKPTITLVVAQKRHHTRFFLEDQGGDERRNISPGTVVDTVVVHPFEFDFYLCSHYGQLGTSKPTHYYVLLDDHNFTSDQVQELIYHMCFTSAQCTKPISIVPPVHYADRVATRGRMYQEVLMEMQSPSSTNSFTAYASASSSTSSFDDASYKLHTELQDSMFFI